MRRTERKKREMCCRAKYITRLGPPFRSTALAFVLCLVTVAKKKQQPSSYKVSHPSPVATTVACCPTSRGQHQRGVCGRPSQTLNQNPINSGFHRRTGIGYIYLHMYTAPVPSQTEQILQSKFHYWPHNRKEPTGSMNKTIVRYSLVVPGEGGKTHSWSWPQHRAEEGTAPVTRAKWGTPYAPMPTAWHSAEQTEALNRARQNNVRGFTLLALSNYHQFLPQPEYPFAGCVLPKHEANPSIFNPIGLSEPPCWRYKIFPGVSTAGENKKKRTNELCHT